MEAGSSSNMQRLIQKKTSIIDVTAAQKRVEELEHEVLASREQLSKLRHDIRCGQVHDLAVVQKRLCDLSGQLDGAKRASVPELWFEVEEGEEKSEPDTSAWKM